MHGSPHGASARVLAWGILALLVPPWPARAETLPAIAACEAAIDSSPRSVEAYQCLLPYVFTRKERVLGFVDARLRRSPSDPHAGLYSLILHYLAGDAWQSEAYDRVAEAFAREHDLAGEFEALA
ncbi:MAG TPA: hypothetical protein VFN91_00605, partial [Myxococcaceae bacterium]|nr:hypothetical protein [Myxococcaceae bacterium]